MPSGIITIAVTPRPKGSLTKTGAISAIISFIGTPHPIRCIKTGGNLQRPGLIRYLRNDPSIPNEDEGVFLKFEDGIK
jgi:hypothetical protein